MITDSAPEALTTTSDHPGIGRQLWLLLFAFGVGLLALVGAIMLADAVFPEPTMWRMPLMIVVLVAVAVAERRQFRALFMVRSPAPREAGSDLRA